ncbi:ABC-2 type transport system permease protein [Pedobacter sp. ok626]|uniref:Gldg family protein n=1 Tax=Pedobacter sp. ok626 TaxID=1761882 RepID=UPI00088AF70F|nr:Gldg family protein [Pedobacter sp. ok626]SDL10389.1 ABC-2 type transport system permease protein [Pedobacter sp. ok626]
MNTTLRIAKLELNTLFYSPIAWFLSIIFLFQCALKYTSGLQILIGYQEVGGLQLQWLQNSTISVFGLQMGLLGDVIRKVYFYLPLLTMGLISREVNSGTIKLLYSSPVKVSQIVLGKFMAMMTYNLVLIGILLIFAVATTFNVENADLGFIMPGIFAIYLLLCAYAAIGLFMSCLTSYQVVAAISTLVCFALLAYIGTVWQDKDFVRDLTYFLSISGRAERMIYGLISTNHVFYFLLIISMFLAFSVIKLESGRTSKSGLQIALRYVGVLIVALTIGYFTSRPGLIGYYDATRGNTQTLTPATQKIIKELGDEPLEVTSYINLVDGFYRGGGEPEQRNRDLDRWEAYRRFKSNIKLNYVYYYDVPAPEMELFKQYPGKSLKQIAEQYAYSFKTDISHFLSPEEIKKVIDLSGEENRYVMEMKYKGKRTFLRLFYDNERYPTETEVGAAMKRLMVKLPKIVFVEGEFERSKDKTGDRDYGMMVGMKTNRLALINQGFDIGGVNLDVEDIPADVTVLVIADPRRAFSTQALNRIQNYIDKGGNLLIAAEPGKQSVLAPLLKPLGVDLSEGMLVEKSKDNGPELVRALLTKQAAGLSKGLLGFAKDSVGVSMPGVLALSYGNKGTFSIQSLLVTDSRVSWNRKGSFALDSAVIDFSAAQGDQRGPFPTALALSRKVNGKEQRIAIIGDADFMSTGEMKRWGNANGEFSTQLFGWFTKGEFPIDTSRPDPIDNHINLTYKQLDLLKVLLMGIFPGVLTLVAVVFLVRRKRK